MNRRVELTIGTLFASIYAALCASGCASSAASRPPVETAAQATPPTVTLAELPAAPRVVTWFDVLASADGYAASMPAEPVEFAPWKDGAMRVSGVKGDDRRDKRTFYRIECIQYVDHAPMGGTVEALARVTTDKLRDAVETPAALGDLRGVAVEGTTEHGASVLVRAALVGARYYVLWAQAPQGELDRTVAERMFASFRVVPSWVTFASPEGRFTVSAPAHAGIVRTQTKVNGAEVRTVTFDLGGASRRAFSVSVTELGEAAARMPLDTWFDEVAHSLEEDGKVVRARIAIEHEGWKGREVVVEKSSGIRMRARAFLTRRRAYVVMAEAAGGGGQDAVEDDTAAHVLESFHIGEAP